MACEHPQDHNSSIRNPSNTKNNDDANAKKKSSSVRFHQLFRYGDRTDGVILLFGVCACLIHGICFGLYLLLFGRLTGMFNIQSQKSSMNSYSSVWLFEVMNYIYWLLIISSVQLIAAALRHFLFELTAQRQTNRIRIRLFQAILQRNICYFDKHSIGQLNAKLFDNIDKINSAIGFDLSTMLQLITSMITIILIGLLINWKLTLIMMCLIPFVILTVHLFAKVTTREAIKEFIAYAKAGQIVQEVFSSLRTVLSLNGSQFEQKRYANELDASYWNSIRKGVALGILIGWLYFTTYLIYALTFIFGVIFMHGEGCVESMISDIIVIAICFGQCISLVGLIGPFLQTCGEAQAAARPVFELIDEIEETNATIEREDEFIVDGDIRFDNVNFVYPSRPDLSILQNLTFVARAGETTALIGPSGSGKSTCMSLLLRYYEPSSGEITMNGRCLTDYNVEQLRSHIGIVSQEPILFNTSIYENIRYGKQNATQNEIEEAAKQANAHDFIMQLPNKYETLVGESGVQLSGGEKQRIALARALVKQPSLLLLDEATSALDSANEKLVEEALDRACKGRTTIVIAHRLRTIRNAHRIYLLSNGTIIEQGTHDTLMAQKQSKYQQMITAQTINSTEIDDNDQSINRIQIDDNDDDDDLVEETHLLHNEQTVSEDQPSNNRSTFVRLLAMNRPEWIIILIGCIICIAIGMTQPLFAILLTRIVNAFKICTYDEQRRQVVKFSILFLLLGFFCIVLRLFQFGAFSMSGWQLTKRVRLRAFESLLRQEMGYFDRFENSCGAISGRLSLDAMAVQQMIGTRLGIVFEALAMLTFGLILGYLFNWKLASIFFIFVFFVFVLVVFDIRCQSQINTQNSLILARSNSLSVEAIDNIRTVKQFLLEKEFLRQYTQLIHKSYLIRRKYSSIIALIFGLYWSSVLYQTTAIYWLTLILIQRNEFQFEDVIYVFAFASFFSQSIRVISSLSKEMGASVSAARSFFELFDRIPSIDNGSTKGQELIDFRGEIQFNRIQFAYPTRPTTCVIKRFQLTIKPGQRVAIVGTSGCGKSTLIQILERFYDVIDGQILIDGVNIRQLNLYWIRSRLGLVSQEPVLFDLTIAQNIAYGLENICEEQIRDAAMKANIHEFIQMLPNGYETRVGSKGNQISGGEKQRIAIARVLLRQPKILLLDEATSAMDSYNEQMIQQALEQAQIEDSTRTSIIIAHRLSTIRSCDLIIVLDRGSIAESGTHTQLIQRRGLYYQMFFHNI